MRRHGWKSVCPRVDEIPFDSERKRMTTVHKEGSHFRVFVKGGLDEVLTRCTKIFDGKERTLTAEDVRRIQQTAEEMSSAALRVLAFAMAERKQLAEDNKEEAYEQELTFLGHGGHDRPAAPYGAGGRWKVFACGH